MSNINGVGGYSGLRAVSAALSQRSGRISQAEGSDETKQDEVEISSIARYMSEIAAMPAMRMEKVNEVREALADGTYDIEGRLSQAVDRMLEEELG